MIGTAVMVAKIATGEIEDENDESKPTVKRARAGGKKSGQFVLHAKVLHGNLYDGHTLGTVITETQQLTGREIERIYVDKETSAKPVGGVILVAGGGFVAVRPSRSGGWRPDRRGRDRLRVSSRQHLGAA